MKVHIYFMNNTKTVVVLPDSTNKEELKMKVKRMLAEGQIFELGELVCRANRINNVVFDK